MSLERTTEFAQALDTEDYDSAQALLSATCRYDCRGETFVGPTAIIASYRGNGDHASSEFDGIEYESRIEPFAGGFCIHFFDYLERSGKRHTFKCKQHVEFDSAGLICRIEHVDLPGEREALAAFRSAC